MDTKDGWYGMISGILGGLAGLITFFAAWFSFAGSYGLLGVALGWFPASFLGAFAALLAAVLWPLGVLALGGMIIMIVSG